MPPLLYGDAIYIFKSNSGILSVFNGRTGKEYYGQQRVEGISIVFPRTDLPQNSSALTPPEGGRETQSKLCIHGRNRTLRETTSWGLRVTSKEFPAVRSKRRSSSTAFVRAADSIENRGNRIEAIVLRPAVSSSRRIVPSPASARFQVTSATFGASVSRKLNPSAGKGRGGFPD